MGQRWGVRAARWLWVVPTVGAAGVLYGAGSAGSDEWVWAVACAAAIAVAAGTQIRLRGLKAYFTVDDLITVPAVVVLGPAPAALMAAFGSAARTRSIKPYQLAFNVALAAAVAGSASLLAEWTRGSGASAFLTVLLVATYVPLLTLAASQVGAWLDAGIGFEFSSAGLRVLAPWAPLTFLWSALAVELVTTTEGVVAATLLLVGAGCLYQGARKRAQREAVRQDETDTLIGRARQRLEERDRCATAVHDGPLQRLLATAFELELGDSTLSNRDLGDMLRTASGDIRALAREQGPAPAAPEPREPTLVPEDASWFGIAVPVALAAAVLWSAAAGADWLVISLVGGSAALSVLRATTMCRQSALTSALRWASIAAAAAVIAAESGAGAWLMLVVVVVVVVAAPGIRTWFGAALHVAVAAAACAVTTLVSADGGSAYGAIAAGLPVAAAFALARTVVGDELQQEHAERHAELIRDLAQVRHRERTDLERALMKGPAWQLDVLAQQVEHGAVVGATLADAVHAVAVELRDTLNDGAGSVAITGLHTALTQLCDRFENTCDAEIHVPHRFGVFGTPEHLAAAAAVIIVREILSRDVAPHSVTAVRLSGGALGGGTLEVAVELHGAVEDADLAGVTLSQAIADLVGGSVELHRSEESITVTLRVPVPVLEPAEPERRIRFEPGVY